jgi:hypothetical protein
MKKFRESRENGFSLSFFFEKKQNLSATCEQREHFCKNILMALDFCGNMWKVVGGN